MMLVNCLKNNIVQQIEKKVGFITYSQRARPFVSLGKRKGGLTEMSVFFYGRGCQDSQSIESVIIITNAHEEAGPQRAQKQKDQEGLARRPERESQLEN